MNHSQCVLRSIMSASITKEMIKGEVSSMIDELVEKSSLMETSEVC